MFYQNKKEEKMNKQEKMKAGKKAKMKSWEVHAVWAVEYQIDVEARSKKEAINKAFEDQPLWDDNWKITDDGFCEHIEKVYNFPTPIYVVGGEPVDEDEGQDVSNEDNDGNSDD